MKFDSNVDVALETSAIYGYLDIIYDSEKSYLLWDPDSFRAFNEISTVDTTEIKCVVYAPLDWII